ncbi:MAG: DUF2493 domain-containing protein [Fibrobacterota bacterium]
MKVAVIGSRSFSSYDILCRELDTMNITEIVSGGAKGADTLAERYAAEKSIPVKKFLPDWKKHDKGAGIQRNKKIVDYADRVIAFWDGRSRGTQSGIDFARKAGKDLRVITGWYIPG